MKAGQRLLGALVASWTAVCAADASATSWEQYGFGPRSQAMAGAAEAAADDYFCLYNNPANLALAKRIHVGLGTDAIWQQMQVDRLKTGGGQPTRLPRDNYLIDIGISTPLPGWLEGKAALGAAIHLPMGGPTRLDSNDVRQPQLPLYDALGDRLALVIGLAVKPAPWLALGVSSQVLTSLSGRADIDLSLLDKRVTYKAMQVQLSTELFPIVGVTVLPASGVRLAASWRRRSFVRYGLPLDVTVEQVGMLRFAIAGIGLWLPDVWTAGASAQRGKWLWTATTSLQRWSAMPPQSPAVQVSLDDRALAEPGENWDTLVNSQTQPVQLGAKDIVVPRLGVQWQPLQRLSLRAGLAYRPTPLPKADGPANYLDAPATTLSVGAGVVLDDPTGMTGQPLTVDVAVGLSVLTQRTVVKRDPEDPIGGTSLSGQALTAGIALHHDF
jgi:long-subunit fatty acid transport protein